MAGSSRLRYVVVILVFLAILAVPFLLRPEEAEPEAEARTLVMVTPHPENTRREFEAAFSDYTQEKFGYPVTVEWLDVGGTLQAQRYVDDQFGANPEGIGIDLFWGGGVDPFLHFVRKGHLHACSIPDDVLSRIPPTCAGMAVYDPEMRWFGTCMAGFGLLYNLEVLDRLGLPKPQEWADLGRGEYFTHVSSADPRQSGSMHMCYEIIFQAYGWQEGWALATRLGGNCRGFTGSASDVPREVATGEAACGMAIDSYGLRAVAEAGEDRMGFHLPEGLTVVNPDAIGVLKGAPHLELAEEFVTFCLSERAQKLWILEAGAPGGPRQFQLYRMPVIPDLAQNYPEHAVVKLDPFDFEGSIEFDTDKMSRRWKIVNDLFGARIIDVHEELAAAWERARGLPEDHPDVQRLLTPPITEERMMELAGGKWDDARFRADTIAGWSAEAQQLYRRIAGGG